MHLERFHDYKCDGRDTAVMTSDVIVKLNLRYYSKSNTTGLQEDRECQVANPGEVVVVVIFDTVM